MICSRTSPPGHVVGHVGVVVGVLADDVARRMQAGQRVGTLLGALANDEEGRTHAPLGEEVADGCAIRTRAVVLGRHSVRSGRRRPAMLPRSSKAALPVRPGKTVGRRRVRTRPGTGWPHAGACGGPGTDRAPMCWARPRPARVRAVGAAPPGRPWRKCPRGRPQLPAGRWPTRRSCDTRRPGLRARRCRSLRGPSRARPSCGCRLRQRARGSRVVLRLSGHHLDLVAGPYEPGGQHAGVVRDVADSRVENRAVDENLHCLRASTSR